MKRIMTTIVFMLASFVALSGALAQQQHSVRVSVPFDFNASGTQLPAGIYTITTRDNLTSITKDGTKEFAFVSTIPFVDTKPGNSKLVFSTYAGQHFLRKVLCTELGVSLELLPSRPELKARAQTTVQTASNWGR